MKKLNIKLITKRILKNLILLLLVWAPLQAEVEVEHKPTNIAALQEVGRLQSGVVGGEALTILKDEWVDHFGAFISKEIVINKRLHIYGGLGGVFQFRKPELVTLTVDGQQKKAFFIGPTRTEAEFHIGDLENPFLKIGMGMFGYKYNPDAHNLGEYMFRTGIYPNYIMTGGYAIVNSAAGYLQGLKANFNFGSAKLDLFLTTETAMPPLYDFSFSAIGEYNIMDGFITLGGGIQFKGLFSVDGDRTQRELDNNGYINVGGVNYSKNSTLYFNKSSFYQAKSAEYATSNPAMSQIFADSGTYYDSIAQMVQNDNSPITYFTSAGTKLMGRISIDPKKLMKTEIFSPSDLRLYAEAALLGWKDYPIFYTNKSERLPIMVGFNLPTFKFFGFDIGTI